MIPTSQQDPSGRVVEAAWDPLTSSWTFLRVNPHKSKADALQTVGEVIASPAYDLTDMSSLFTRDERAITLVPSAADPQEMFLSFM